MSAGPRGPVNGEEVPKSFGRRSVVEAIERALPPAAEPVAELPWPRVYVFDARPRAKLHKSLPTTWDVLWGLKLGQLLNEGEGVGFTFTAGMPARNLATALRMMADRMDEIALAVEEGRKVPNFEVSLPQSVGQGTAVVGGQPVDKPANDSEGAAAEGQSSTLPGGTEPGSQS